MIGEGNDAIRLFLIQCDGVRFLVSFSSILSPHPGTAVMEVTQSLGLDLNLNPEECVFEVTFHFKLSLLDRTWLLLPTALSLCVKGYRHSSFLKINLSSENKYLN